MEKRMSDRIRKIKKHKLKSTLRPTPPLIVKEVNLKRKPNPVAKDYSGTSTFDGTSIGGKPGKASPNKFVRFLKTKRALAKGKRRARR